jgi:L-ribulokinase
VSVVAGVDFGTLSVRISIFDKDRGKLGSAVAEYPLHHSPSDPHLKTQSHDDQMAALVHAMHEAFRVSGIDGREIKSIALDTTGSSVIMVGEGLVPLGEYYLWCDHRAASEAAEITRAAHAFHGGTGFEGIAWCGGVYSSEWGWSKLLHWLRHNPELRPRLVTALEHCDMVAATLCGVTDPNQIPRSICAMGHKWMWNPRWGGLPPEEFLVSIDPLLAGVREKISAGLYATSDQIAGRLSAHWALQLGLTPGIPIPTGAFDAHWDAIGANIRLGDVVNVIGTSTCIIGLSDQQTLVPGVCGVVPGSVVPGQVGIEAGMSAVGDVFAAIAARAGATVAALSEASANYRAGQTGLLRLTWDNGDRTVLVNPALGGVTFGWNLHHTPADELFAAIEGTALQTRIIFDRMSSHGAPHPPRHQRRRNPQTQPAAQPDLCQRAQQTRPRARGAMSPRSAPSSSRSSPPETSPPSRPRRTHSAHPSKSSHPNQLPLRYTIASTHSSATPTSRSAAPTPPPAPLGRILPELQSIRRSVTSIT